MVITDKSDGDANNNNLFFVDGVGQRENALRRDGTAFDRFARDNRATALLNKNKKKSKIVNDWDIAFCFIRVFA